MPKKKKGDLSYIYTASVHNEGQHIDAETPDSLNRLYRWLNPTLFGQIRYGKSMKISDLIVERLTKEKIDAENAR
jgi:hypothetical protein